MAICECPEHNGKKVSEWDIDELMTEALLLIEVATDSDILKNNLCVQEIKIENNGEYTIDRQFLSKLVRPFIKSSTFEMYKYQIQIYKIFYNREPSEKLRITKELASIDNAFVHEFGLSIEKLLQVCCSLFKIAVEKDSLVVETTIEEIKEKCKREGLSSEVVSSFMDSFTIFRRSKWESLPDGFKTRDILPTKYNRRLSFNVRPLLALGKLDDSNVFYGINNLYMAMRYLLHQITEGNFPVEFFKSDEMKSLCGAINNKKGDAFNKTVADKVSSFGWSVQLNINMSQIGASKNFGDIDILAWKSNQIKIIESKRLQPARNISEIVNSLKRFKGENNDLLEKHINRVNWIKNNLNSISNIIGFTPSVECISENIVTNVLIPSQYVDFLPVHFKSIIQIDDLENEL